MITLHGCPDLSSIADFKAEYLRGLLAPMDGMWSTGFTDPSPHWEIRVNDERAGYYAASDSGTLLQFFVVPAFVRLSRTLFDHVVSDGSLRQATVSTIDPPFLSLCLDVQSMVKVHTYLYETAAAVGAAVPTDDDLEFQLVDLHELEQTIPFQQACLSGDQDLSGWLRGYSSNLIERDELFVLSHGDEWLGLGELRRSDTQTGICDLGMMVSPDHRRQGWASYILNRLRALADRESLRSICSTTVENVAAQAAIARAGFVSRHRILDVTF